VLAAAPAVAQQLVEPIPQRRDSISRPSRAPAQQQGAMMPCPEYGPGFARAPGSATCFRIDGRVRGEMQFRQRGSRLGDSVGTSAGVRVGLDARTPTEFGTLRVVTRLNAQRNTGAWER
jgi:hypothetical protein